MTEQLLPRIIENKDWATILFVICFVLLAITRSSYEARFNEFLKLIFSDKYAKIYRDSSNLKGNFLIRLFIVQIISYAFFAQLTLHIFDFASKTDWLLFIRISYFLLYFILGKYLIEKIVATSFNIEQVVDHFNLQKATYRIYISVLILPFNMILFYYNDIPKFVPITILAFSLCISIFSYFISIKTYQNLIMGKLFYFILYLCTLEIAPYYFLYYWISKEAAL